MKTEASTKEIRALMELSDLDRGLTAPTTAAQRQARAAAARRVPARLLDRYEVLLEVGRTPAVVAIVHGACSGCHVRLPTMLDYRARRTPAVHTCPSCRRMLYAPQLVCEDPTGGDEQPRSHAPASARRRA